MHSWFFSFASQLFELTRESSAVREQAEDPSADAERIHRQRSDEVISDRKSSQPQERRTKNELALNVRLSLCNRLANAILEVHRLRLVHKNINSASVLVMSASDAAMSKMTERDIRIFLLNWHLVRKVDVASVPSPERQWWKGIYQHPGRQIALTEEEYTMGHDIYSLGVCMLETLLWKPFVHFGEGSVPAISPLFAEHALELGVVQDTPGSIQSFLNEPEETRDTQRVLLAIANQHLPAVAGQKLTSLVSSCLTCLEDGFGQLSFGPGTGPIEVGMNYITAVKNSLSEICV